MSNDLPILYVINPTVAVTGAFVVTRTAARLLKDSVRIVLVLPRGADIPSEELQGFWRIEYLPMAILSKNIGVMLRYVPLLFSNAFQLKRWMQRDNAQLLQLNDFYLMQGAAMRLLGFKGFIASWVRCNPRWIAGPLATPMLYFARHSANRLVAVSRYVQTLLQPHSSSILYDCYVGKTRQPKIWKQEEEKTFMYVGNYIQGKGQDIAMAAFAEAAKHDATIKLAFYGGDMGLQKNRDYRAKLEASVRELGLNGRITFNEFAHDTFTILEPAYAALNCSTSESFSMTVLEASGAGLPVISTASGGPQEIIKEGVTGYLAPVGDVETIAQRIITLAQDPNRAAQMGQAGAAHVREAFSPARFYEGFKALILGSSP